MPETTPSPAPGSPPLPGPGTGPLTESGKVSGESSGAEERRKLTGRAGIVAAGTLASRVLGLVRDQVIAACFSRTTTDAFFVAFTIPNVLRQLLAEGAVQNAALPVLEKVRETEGPESARRTFASLRGLSFLALLTVTVLGMVFADGLVDLFATGYHGRDGQFERTVLLTRWLFPYIFLMGTAALGIAALNLHRRFHVASFAPALLNVAFIAAALGLPGWLVAHDRDPVLALAVGALLGGVLQVVAQWPSLRTIGYLGLPQFHLAHPHVREVLRRMGPVLFGIGIYYVDVVLARRFLSELESGSQSYFSWALRLCDFPQGIFVMALQTATLPSLSRLVARGDLREVEQTFSFALRLTLFVGICASAAAVGLAEPLTTVIFQRGHFDAVSSHETAKALAAQGAGIWMVAAVRQLVSVYYAFGDTKSPVRVAAIDLLAFVVLAWFLRRPYGHLGISIAVTGASAVQMTLLALGLRKRLPTLPILPIVQSCYKTAAASLAAVVVARFVAQALTLEMRTTALRLVLPGLVSAATFTVVFLFVAWMLKSDELQTMTRAFRRGHRRSMT